MVPAAAAAGVTVEAVTRAVAVTAQDRAAPWWSVEAVVEAVVERGGGAGGIRTGRGNMGVGGGGECDEAPRDLTSMLVYVYSVYVAGGARPRSRACANVRLHSSTRRQCQLDQLGLRPQ
jgi:hypothetical protein